MVKKIKATARIFFIKDWKIDDAYQKTVAINMQFQEQYNVIKN